MADVADETVTANDQAAVQTQLESLTISTQLIHDFMLGATDTIVNPEGGTIRTITGINKAIDDALPGYADVQAAVTEANAAKVGAEQARDDAEDFATQSANYAATALYKTKDVPTGATITVDPVAGTVQNLVLSQAQSTLTVKPTNDADGFARQITLFIKQGTGSNKITWPANVYWSNGRVPVLSYTLNTIDLVCLISLDKGATWRGVFNGGWFSA